MLFSKQLMQPPAFVGGLQSSFRGSKLGASLFFLSALPTGWGEGARRNGREDREQHEQHSAGGG